MLSEPPEGFGLDRIADLRDYVMAGGRIEMLAPDGQPMTTGRGSATLMSCGRRLIPARITPPAPPEPDTEWVPLAESWGREVMVDGRRCPIFAVDLSTGIYKADDGCVHHALRPSADGKVEVLGR